MREQLRLFLDDEEAAVLDDPDPLGQLLRFFEVVGGEHDRRSLGSELADVGPEIAAQLHVDAGGRLVEEEDSRAVDQGLGDEEPALHAAGERPRIGGALVEEAKGGEDLDQPLLGKLDPEVACLEAERLLDREEGVEVDLLRYQADRAAGEAVVALDVVAEHFHGACGLLGGAGDQADERRLAGAVRSEEGEYFAAPDVERDAVQGGERAVAFGRAPQADGGKFLVGHGRREDATGQGPVRGSSTKAKDRSFWALARWRG